MKRDFVLTKEDYVDFNLFIYKTSPAIKRKRAIQTVVFPLLYLLIPVFLNVYKSIPYRQTYPVFIIAAIVWIIAYPKISKYGVKKNVERIVAHSEKSGSKMTGNYSVYLEDDGVIVENEHGNIKMNWDNISELKEDDERIYIFNNPMTAYIIKKNAFENIEEESIFKQTVIDKSEEAKLA